MAQDKSYISVPPISFTNALQTGRESIGVSSTPTAIDTGGETTERPTDLNLLGGRPTVGADSLNTISTGARREPAEVQSSDGSSGPSGLGDTLDNGPDNSRLGGSNSGGGTPTF